MLSIPNITKISDVDKYVHPDIRAKRTNQTQNAKQNIA